VCRDEATARRRFGVGTGEIRAFYTRSGRALFVDLAKRDAVLARTRDALVETGLLDELSSDWVLLDAEIMLWSAKAQALITGQYGATGAAARIGMGAAGDALRRAVANGRSLRRSRADWSGQSPSPPCCGLFLGRGRHRRPEDRPLSIS
jgi:protein phosphatase